MFSKMPQYDNTVYSSLIKNKWMSCFFKVKTNDYSCTYIGTNETNETKTV